MAVEELKSATAGAPSPTSFPTWASAQLENTLSTGLIQTVTTLPPTVAGPHEVCKISPETNVLLSTSSLSP